MFKEYLKLNDYYAKFCWLAPDGTTHEEHFSLSDASLDALQNNKGYLLNAPVLRASFCGSPIPYSVLKNRSVASYMFREMLTVYKSIQRSIQQGNEENMPGIYVCGGMYPSKANPLNKVFGLEHPGNELPYVYVGEPWHPCVCVYRLTEDGCAIKVREAASCGGYASTLTGPMKVELSQETIQKIQLSMQQRNMHH